MPRPVPWIPENRLLTKPSDVILERLQGLHPKVIDLSLGRVETLLHRLGDPHENLPSVVHVAGTNGKGSVIAFLRAILEAAGYRVHVFTSPHLVRFNERIRLAGDLIAEDALAAVLAECETVNGGDAITFFEITAVAALLAFTRAPADIVLLETGLGGRLDATNVVARPALSVLSPISIDHQQYLGETLKEIAGEKCGILKLGTACVAAAQDPAVAAVIKDRAANLGAPLLMEDDAWSVRVDGANMIFHGMGVTHTLPAPALHGAHQIHNAGLAIACAEALEDFSIPVSALARGLETAAWPGRLQRLTEGALVGLLPAGWELWLDGGHNAAAGKILAAHAAQWPDKPLHLVVGMMVNKDPAAFLRPLANQVASLRTLSIPGEGGSQDAEAVAAAARTLGIDAAPAAGIAAALADIAATANSTTTVNLIGPGPARVLVTGSLYLVGAALGENG